jgi:hypothetical protein
MPKRRRSAHSTSPRRRRSSPPHRAAHASPWLPIDRMKRTGGYRARSRVRILVLAQHRASAGGSSLPEIRQKRCLATPHPAPCPLSPPPPLSCDVVVRRGVGRRRAWWPRSLHTAEATGSKPVTPTHHQRRSHRLSLRPIAARGPVRTRRGRAGAAAPSLRRSTDHAFLNCQPVVYTRRRSLGAGPFHLSWRCLRHRHLRCPSREGQAPYGPRSVTLCRKTVSTGFSPLTGPEAMPHPARTISSPLHQKECHPCDINPS